MPLPPAPLPFLLPPGHPGGHQRRARAAGLPDVEQRRRDALCGWPHRRHAQGGAQHCERQGAGAAHHVRPGLINNTAAAAIYSGWRIDSGRKTLCALHTYGIGHR